MNFCLVAINVYYLWKMMKSTKEYDLTSVDKDDEYLKYLIAKYKDDIISTFPGVNIDMADVDKAFVISYDGKPVGITLGKEEDTNMDLILDYSIPQFRDNSVGKYLFSRLTELGFKTITYKGPTENHMPYLKNTGFVEDNGVFVKTL